MRQCLHRAFESTASTTLVKAPPLRRLSLHLFQRRGTTVSYASAAAASGSKTTSKRSSDNSSAKVPTTRLSAIARPSRRTSQDAIQWIDRLDPVLPPKLRSSTRNGATKTNVAPSEVSAFIADARRLKQHDLLLELARQGRWKVVVWLVTYLVDNLWAGNPSTAWRLSETPFDGCGSLDDLVERPVSLKAQDHDAPRTQSLDQAVLLGHPLGRGEMRNKVQGYQALGQIWESLGYMIIEDSAENKGSIRPEILQLIAILHSRGIMPDSIYSYSPQHSRLAGTQPPTLRLLSSQIMTSLSDAAWNARQALALEEASFQGSRGLFDGPELPSSDYRVHVAGVRHEIWLELVLWACLHGGWVEHGAKIIETITKRKDLPWSPLSWRETMSPMTKVGDESTVDWSQTEYLFNRGQVASTSNNIASNFSVERTISSEVISAYVDAIVHQLSTGVGERGLAVGSIVTILISIRKFLTQNNFGLESTSWDAIVQRILESNSLDIEEAPGVAELLLSLSTRYGEDDISYHVPTRDEAWRPLSPYLIDGSALTLSVSHRTLSAYINRGESAGAFRTFRELQTRTDNNKKLSIAAFFRSLKEQTDDNDATNLTFSSPVAGIQYPGMFPLLPATTLAPFLDLVTDIKAFQFGSWLIASQDVDGPTVGPMAYQNPIMVPSLIRFLAASRNDDLLAKVLQAVTRNNEEGKPLPANVLFAIQESQLQLNKTDAALKTFDTILRCHGPQVSVTEAMIALLCREYMKSPDANPSVRQKLVEVLRGQQRIDRKARRNIAAVMMHIDDELKDLCRRAIALPENMTVYPDTRAFNIILQGCVARHGSVAGRELLCVFSKTAHVAMVELDVDMPITTGIPLTRGNVRPESIQRVLPGRLDFTIEQARRSSADEAEWGPVRVTGRFTPNASTVRIILARRLQELGDERESEDLNMDGTIRWAKRMLRLLGMRDEDIHQETMSRTEVPVQIEASL